MDFERLRKSPPVFLNNVAIYDSARLTPENPRFTLLLPTLATAVNTQDWSGGSSILDLALSKCTTTGETAYVLACKALYCAVQNQLVEAAEAAEAAARLAPHSPMIMEVLARSLLRAGRLEEAVTAYEQTVELDDGNNQAWAALAVLYALGDAWELADTAASKARRTGAEIGGVLVHLSALFASVMCQGSAEDLLWADALKIPPDLDAALALLPSVEGRWPEHPVGDVLMFVACDPVYFEDHALALIWSLEAIGRPASLHLHLFDPTEAALTRVSAQAARCRSVRLTWTQEQVDPAQFPAKRVYYSSARYCRAAELVRHADASVIIVDADALFRQPLETLLAAVDAGADVALPVHEESPPWNRYAAGCVLFRPSVAGRLFLDRVASIVAHNLAQGTATWFIDQIALCLAAEHVSDRPSVAPLDLARFCDTGHGPDASIWVVTTNKFPDGPYLRFRQELQARFGCY